MRTSRKIIARIALMMTMATAKPVAVAASSLPVSMIFALAAIIAFTVTGKKFARIVTTGCEEQRPMSIVKDLVFHRIEGSPPVMTCNACGATKQAVAWRIADIALDDSGDTASIVVCSRRCEQTFKHHPMAERYVRDLLERVYAMRDTA
jgi:hypothetical protein